MTILPRLRGARPVGSDRRRRSFFAVAVALAIFLPSIGPAGADTGLVAAPTRLQTAAVMLPHLAARLAHHEPVRILAFGSSSTEGVGASSPDHAYPAQLEADLQGRVPAGEKVTVLNRGIGGEDADDMMARLARDVLAAHPDLVIWQTGTNDPLRKLPLDRFVAETRDGIAQMRAAGIDVVLMGPQDCRLMRETPGASAYRDAVRRISAELGVPLIRRYELIKAWLASGQATEAQLLAGDGLHMADAGYERLAVEVARVLLAGAGVRPAAPATAAP